MRYRTIMLNGNEKNQISFVKYTNEYKRDLEELKEMNPYFADIVEKCPTLYSELSEHQSYMIVSSEKGCIGAIYIGTSTDEKNLEIEVQFIEEKFENDESILPVLNQIVNTLGFYCYDKENIEIKLFNNINSNDLDKQRYKPNYISENVTTYTVSNKHNNKLFSKLFNEMRNTEQNLINWGQYWWQEFEMCRDNDRNYFFDDNLIKEYNNGTIPYNEYFYKANAVIWNDINSLRSIRNIRFERNGQIYFKKEEKESKKNSYEFQYNVTKDGFNLKKIVSRKNTDLEINENSDFTAIRFGNLKVIYFKENKIKKIQYKSRVENNSSIFLEIYINNQGEIERCNIDFRTHKNSREKYEKISGIYALRILPKENKFTLNFINRKGLKSSNFACELFKEDEQLFKEILNGNITLELIDELINKGILVINRKAISNNKSTISVCNEPIILSCCEMQKDAINYVKQIKGEIPLPQLQENLEKFIEEYDFKKEDAKRMVLKK